jgi:hypothetical protein
MQLLWLGLRARKPGSASRLIWGHLRSGAGLQIGAVISHRSLLRPGQSRSWTNPDSGAHGEVAFVKTTQDEGMACHQLRNTI